MFVRNNYDGDARASVQLLDDPHDLAARSCIEVSGRFVGQEDRRGLDQRPGYADPLLLAAREFDRLVVHSIGQSDLGQGIQRPFLSPAPFAVEQRQFDVCQG